ncbi:thiamine pyrophosphokinase [Gracilibacillus ureilyticus]|uniref:Thiamine diphosphokinase n=1 Tax=Gracilibacillus ureilyticus TaxID=531814 RepID=A0A1H9L2S5_9BACI|nr:thiamine diphosphokinase [Gracilibacillus ureilyticus]SER05313.1 thiamine pyrophosphokinase [Gracilibacillus ureilyticus]
MRIGIVAGGPERSLAELTEYKEMIDLWIGADRGTAYIMKHQLTLHIAVGDFDSVTETELASIRMHAQQFDQFPAEKDETDLEIAVRIALTHSPDEIYLFGVTGGRLDHELVNVQLLYQLVSKGIKAAIIDNTNQLSLHLPGVHTVRKEANNQYISFLPFTHHVGGLTLTGFYYPLENKTIEWGATLCISNQIINNYGTFSFDDGILIMIKSIEPFKK